MSKDTHTILCGNCRIPVKGPGDPKEHDMITCPTCGRSDNLKNVMRSVSAFVEETAGRYLQESLGKATRGSKFLKFTSKAIPKGNHPFIADFKL